MQLSDETNSIFVGGDAGDQVTMVGAWTSNGTANIDGMNYELFTVTGVDATLHVETDVTTAII